MNTGELRGSITERLGSSRRFHDPPRLLHILCGVVWVGTVLFTASLLLPSLRAAGLAAGSVMAELGKRRKMPLIMMIIALVTIASGIWLMVLVSGGAVGPWMRTGPGQTFALGGALAIVAFVVGFAVNIPTANRVAEHCEKRTGL